MQQRASRALILASVLVLAIMAGGAGAQTVPAQDYSTAQYVQISLGLPNQEAGLRQIEGMPDGQTEPLTEGVGRRSLPGSSVDRYFYFDVHDTYINGGLNKVVMTITYLDRGLTPIHLEYDSLDTIQPDSQAENVVKKRLPVVTRSNTEAWRTEIVSLEDARFGNNQPGGADFRIGSSDELVLRNVSVLRVSHKPAEPPIRVVLDGSEVIFDVPPWVDPTTNRTLVPMRKLFNALGVPNANIAWNEAEGKATARKGLTTIELQIDSAVALVNGMPQLLDQPAVIKNDRTLVPIRFVTERFDLKVDWNKELRVITLSTLAPFVPATPTSTPVQTSPATP